MVRPDESRKPHWCTVDVLRWFMSKEREYKQIVWVYALFWFEGLCEICRLLNITCLMQPGWWLSSFCSCTYHSQWISLQVRRNHAEVELCGRLNWSANMKISAVPCECESSHATLGSGYVFVPVRRWIPCSFSQHKSQFVARRRVKSLQWSSSREVFADPEDAVSLFVDTLSVCAKKINSELLENAYWSLQKHSHML